MKSYFYNLVGVIAAISFACLTYFVISGFVRHSSACINELVSVDNNIAFSIELDDGLRLNQSTKDEILGDLLSFSQSCDDLDELADYVAEVLENRNLQWISIEVDTIEITEQGFLPKHASKYPVLSMAIWSLAVFLVCGLVFLMERVLR